MAVVEQVDACVIGAGMGGIYSTYCLRNMGLTVKCIEAAGDVGGTWYWNRYPGAMSDTHTYLYRYSWDKEDLQTYPWSQYYVYQSEILAYLQHVAKKHQLRQHMQFNTEMKEAYWEENSSRWLVTCSGGNQISARYLINSLGLLSRVHFPDIPGFPQFTGHAMHTARWDSNVGLSGKRVGIIGNGSTGVQVMTAIAPTVGHLTSFQRSPQYSVPSGQGPVTPGYRDRVNSSYEDIWKGVFSSSTGFGVPESTRKTMDATPSERHEVFERAWSEGNGFRFMFSAFGDITTSRQANEEACAFIRNKIDEIVKDPRKASILKPKDLYARRPLCDTGYYQIFNQDNVDVVDLKANPIQQIESTGIRTADGELHELDVLIFATGFDAIEGSYSRVKFRGREGVTLKEHWKSGPRAYGGVACAGFPNMFLVAGPQGPFANFPPVIESEINFIMSMIERAETTNSTGQRSLVEISADAEEKWIDLCNKLVEGSLFTTIPSWIFGENVPGRKPSTNFFFGGLKAYLDWTAAQAAAGFPDLTQIAVAVGS